MDWYFNQRHFLGKFVTLVFNGYAANADALTGSDMAENKNTSKAGSLVLEIENEKINI